MTHKSTPFIEDGAYRGMECSCGFISSTGDQTIDARNMKQHQGEAKPKDSLFEVRPKQLRREWHEGYDTLSDAGKRLFTSLIGKGEEFNASNLSLALIDEVMIAFDGVASASSKLYRLKRYRVRLALDKQSLSLNETIEALKPGKCICVHELVIAHGCKKIIARRTLDAACKGGALERRRMGPPSSPPAYIRL